MFKCLLNKLKRLFNKDYTSKKEQLLEIDYKLMQADFVGEDTTDLYRMRTDIEQK